MPDTYTVSVFPVRKSGFESNSRSRMPTWWQFVIPTSSIPMRIASSDAAGTPQRNASTPRTKSRWSKSSWAVFSVGKPSSNSRVPMRVSTLSG